MKAQNENNDAVWVTYQRVLNYVALSGIFLGAVTILIAANVIWWNIAGIAPWFFLGAALLIYTCLLMILTGPRSFAQIVMWAGMAYMVLTHFMMTVHLRGGEQMATYGIMNLITICATIWYLRHIPPQYKWSQKALGIWVIGIQMIFAILWYANIYFSNYVVDPFEPAIPYAYNSIHYLQTRAWTAKVVTMGNGITMLLTSIYLYVVCKGHKS